MLCLLVACGGPPLPLAEEDDAAAREARMEAEAAAAEVTAAAEAAATISATDTSEQEAICPEPSRKPAPPPEQTLRVSVVDIGSGQPLAGIGVRILPEMDRTKPRRETTDADGVALLHTEGLPAIGEIDFHCGDRAATFPFPSRRLAAPMRYILHEGRGELTARIDPSRCEPVPVRNRRLRLRGMYVPAFESSAFYPCDGLPPEADEFEHEPHSAWAEFRGDAVDDLDAIRLLEDIAGDGAIYVDWSGTLAGPGAYGHFGMSLYLMRVDAVHDTAMRRPRNCSAPGFDEEMRLREEWQNR